MNGGVAQVAATTRSPHSERARVAEASRASIAAWLLAGGPQLSAGPQAGGIAGAVDGHGQPVYVYPENTGYYLQWLAWQALRHGATPVAVQRAAAAQRWLASWLERTDPPQTRVYLGAHPHDWRNSASFFFDLAMVLRGVASAARVGLIRVDEELAAGLTAELSRLVAPDGMFLACLASPATGPLPERWSTRRGGFLAKAAAGVLAAARVLPQVTERLRRAAEATLVASVRSALEQPHEEAHPRLYAIEGALAMPTHAAIAPELLRFARQLEQLLRQAAVRGRLRESPAAGAMERIDIVAQCLRAAYLLRARISRWTPDDTALEKMLHTLVRYTTIGSTRPFGVQSPVEQRNVWTAMFAEQALALTRFSAAGALRASASLCIV